ncbi:hypothetical protein Lal_00022324 [Lupinus albus]|nr:hypothetical protein Lal_00022324 [Lupinus albus]
MKNVFVEFVTLVAIILVIVELGESFSCDDAKNQISPCVSYVTGQGGNAPSSECCNGVRTLAAQTPTTDDKRAACECLKAAASSVPGIKVDLANSVFKQCGVSLTFSISKDIDCKT